MTQMKIAFEPVAASISPQGYKILTGIATIPAIILPEANTHRSDSKNWTSLRAMPVATAMQMTGFRPLHFGKAQKGMQAQEEEIPYGVYDQLNIEEVVRDWRHAEAVAKGASGRHANGGLAKQIANRLMTPFLWCRGVLTSTSQRPGGWPFENFLHLRAKSGKVEPHMHEFAWCVADAIHKLDSVQRGWGYNTYENGRPFAWSDLDPGMWHLPFVTEDEEYDALGKHPSIHTEHEIALASAMRCARSSYNKLEGGTATIEEDAAKARESLLNGIDLHGSPFEHQARCIPLTHVTQVTTRRTKHGLTTDTRLVPYRSGNLVGWEQFRHLLAQEPEFDALRAGTFTDDDYKVGRKRILKTLEERAARGV